MKPIAVLFTLCAIVSVLFATRPRPYPAAPPRHCVTTEIVENADVSVALLPDIGVFCKQFEQIHTYDSRIQALEAKLRRAGTLRADDVNRLTDLKIARARVEAHYNEIARFTPSPVLDSYDLPNCVVEHFH